MGVLESIRVKQENYPYRFKFEDFYRKYELLSSHYSEGRYDLLSEDKKNQEIGKKNAKTLFQEYFNHCKNMSMNNIMLLVFPR